MFQAKVAEKIKTRILCSVIFSSSSFENRAFHEVMFGRAGEATDGNIIRRMRFACWIVEATCTPKISGTYCFSAATVVTQTPPLWYVMRILPVLST